MSEAFPAPTTIDATAPAPPGTTAPAIVVVAGRELTLPPITKADKNAFKAWAGASAIAAVKDQESAMALPGRDPTPERPLSREDFFRLLDSTYARCTTGFFGWNQSGGAMRRRTEEGLAYIVWTCLRRAYPPTDARDPGITFASVLAVSGDELEAAFVAANPDPAAAK